MPNAANPTWLTGGATGAGPSNSAVGIPVGFFQDIPSDAADLGVPRRMDAPAATSREDLYLPSAPLWMQEGEAMVNGPVPIGLGLPGQRPGWVASVETSILQPVVLSKVTSGTNLDAVLAFTGNPVNLPVGALNVTCSPRIELGYRWPEGLGEVRIAYRLVTSNAASVIADNAPGTVRALSTSLRANTIDIDYCFSEMNPGDLPWIPTMLQIPGYLGLQRPHRDGVDPLCIRFRLGARISTIFFDAQATGTQLLDERLMNDYTGGGFHTGIELTKAMPWRPLSLYTRFDASGLYGTTEQSFQRTDAAGNTAFGTERFQNGVPAIDFELGLNWVPTRWSSQLRGTLGYQFTEWWSFADTDVSTATFRTSGLLLRGEYGF